MSNMNLNEYQTRAITTKIYADEVALSYIALGLGGEAVELFEKIQQNKDNICELTDDQLRLMSKEIGDVYWYLAGLAEELNQNLGDVVDRYRKTLPSDVKFDEVVSSLIIKTGAILEIFKKALRDDYELFQNKVLTSEKEEKTNQAIADVVSCLEYLAKFFGQEISSILIQNAEKLASRAKRGTLSGSGDER